MITRRHLGREKTLAFLEELKGTGEEAASRYLPPGATDTPPEMPPEMAAAGAPNGAVFFRGEKRSVLVLPPFPVREKLTAEGIFTGPLEKMLRRDWRLALVLVRLGAYAVGVGEGEKIISSKVGTGNIHGRHRQGGSSAHRFERHRDKQIEYFFTRVCQHAREHIEPQARSLDYIIYGGARTTLQMLQKQCAFLERLELPRLPPLLDIPEPRQAVLEASLRRAWSSEIIEWRED